MPARRDVQSKQATRLARLRVERGLTQAELADRTGLSIANFRRLERGMIDNPPLRYLSNCAIVLGCDLDDLIEDDWRKWMPLTKTKPRPRKPKPEALPG